MGNETITLTFYSANPGKEGNFLCSCLLMISSLSVQSLDKYGGYPQIKGTKTGHWHTENINGREWFVTPEGHAMYVLGINHINAVNETEKQNALTNLSKWNFIQKPV